MSVTTFPAPRLILASASPRRQELLRDAGFEFDIDPAEIDESAHPANLLPSQVATFLADAKAKAVAQRHPDAVVLAADTVVAFGDQLLGKPNDAAHARRMLQLLSGTTHLVITAVCAIHQSARFSKCVREISAVRMRLLGPSEIDHYLETGNWQGKAGGYGIQDPDPFVIKQAGSHTNVVGLPMRLTRQLLNEAGVAPTRQK